MCEPCSVDKGKAGYICTYIGVVLMKSKVSFFTGIIPLTKFTLT